MSTLPTFGQPIVRADIEAGATTLAELDDVVIAAPAGGDILIYDGVDTWRNRVMSGDVAITAAGVTAIQAGVIGDADISPTAEIQVSKLLDGAARQLLQTDVAGTGVEWTDNIDIPGTLDVTGLGTFDAGIIIVAGSLDLNNQGGISNVGVAGNDWTGSVLHLAVPLVISDGPANSEYQIRTDNVQDVSTIQTILTNNFAGQGFLVMVTGFRTAGGGHTFRDLVMAGETAGGTPVVIGSQEDGSPSARTYTMTNAGELEVALAASTYDLNWIAITPSNVT